MNRLNLGVLNPFGEGITIRITITIRTCGQGG